MCECHSTPNATLTALFEQQRLAQHQTNLGSLGPLGPMLGITGPAAGLMQQLIGSGSRPPWAPPPRATEIPYNVHLSR